MTDPSLERLVIVGAGHSGGSAALELRKAGYRGSITLVGEEAHHPYERPPLSKEFLSRRMARERLFLRPDDAYSSDDIGLRLASRVVGIDRGQGEVVLAGDERVAYDKLLLATGARPRDLPFLTPGDRVFALRSISDSLRLRDRLNPGTRVIIVGAGLIGLEVAAAAQALGCFVTVLEAAPQPLGRIVPAAVGRFFARLHRDRGISLHTGVLLKGAAYGAHAVILHTDNTVFEADLVLVCVGAAPNTQLAEDAGLHVDNGIITDEFCRTSDPAIFACGDVTRHFNPFLGRLVRLETWQNAQNQGIAAARNIAGSATPYIEVPWFWSDQYDVNLQVAGVPDDWEDLVWRGNPLDGSFGVFSMKNGVPTGAVCVNAPAHMRFARKLIERAKPVERGLLSDQATSLRDVMKIVA